MSSCVCLCYHISNIYCFLSKIQNTHYFIHIVCESFTQFSLHPCHQSSIHTCQARWNFCFSCVSDIILFFFYLSRALFALSRSCCNTHVSTIWWKNASWAKTLTVIIILFRRTRSIDRRYSLSIRKNTNFGFSFVASIFMKCKKKLNSNPAKCEENWIVYFLCGISNFYACVSNCINLQWPGPVWSISVYDVAVSVHEQRMIV